MINIHNLAGRIANLYYDYDYYDFNDSLEVGETMEDAIFKIERVLSGKGGADSYIDFMDEIIDNIEWERTEDPSDPNYGGDMLKRAKRIRNDLYRLKDGRAGSFKEGAKVRKSCGRRIRESINSECYEEDLETLIDVFPVYGFHRHDFSLLMSRKQRELINTIRKRFEVPEGISIRDYVHTEIDDTRSVDDVIRDGIRDDFDYLESICDGDITPELKNLSYLNYGEDIVSEL